MSQKSKGPQFVRFFGPVLDALRAPGGSGSPTEVADKIAEMLQVPARQQEELTSSGQQRYLNRVQWARLVDGQKLIEMFEHLQLGLKPIKTFEVDVDFFDDFRDGAPGEDSSSDQ